MALAPFGNIAGISWRLSAALHAHHPEFSQKMQPQLTLEVAFHVALRVRRIVAPKDRDILFATDRVLPSVVGQGLNNVYLE